MFKNLLIISALIAAAATSSWSYQNQAAWKTDNAICGPTGVGAGVEQSPINFVRTSITEVAGFKELKTDYWGKAGLKTKNTGHGLQVDGEWGTIVYENITYYIKQFHFHQPSEHTFDGMHYDMEMHMVHTNCATASCTATKFLVLGFVFMLGEESSFLNTINYTKVSATEKSTYKIDGDINLMN